MHHAVLWFFGHRRSNSVQTVRFDKIGPARFVNFEKIRHIISPVSVKSAGRFYRFQGNFDTTKIFEDIVAVTFFLFDRS
jgi:hypothetical protein